MCLHAAGPGVIFVNNSAAAANQRECATCKQVDAKSDRRCRMTIVHNDLTRIRRINLQMHVKMKIHAKINFQTRHRDFASLQQKHAPS